METPPRYHPHPPTPQYPLNIILYLLSGAEIQIFLPGGPWARGLPWSLILSSDNTVQRVRVGQQLVVYNVVNHSVLPLLGVLLEHASGAGWPVPHGSGIGVVLIEIVEIVEIVIEIVEIVEIVIEIVIVLDFS